MGALISQQRVATRLFWKLSFESAVVNLQLFWHIFSYLNIIMEYSDVRFWRKLSKSVLDSCNTLRFFNFLLFRELIETYGKIEIENHLDLPWEVWRMKRSFRLYSYSEIIGVAEWVSFHFDLILMLKQCI